MKNLLANAKFITSDNPRDSVCPVFRRIFTLTEPIRTASLSITSQGIYEARLNEKRVGDFVFAPGWTSYHKRLQVQTYDITEQLVRGENTLTVLLGNGWYYGWIPCGAFEDMGPRSLIASLKITYGDGTLLEINTDEQWTYAKSPILYSDIYDGEIYDANVIPGNWQTAVITEGCRDTLIPQEGEFVREIETLPALSLIITPKGEKVIDFGQEITGYVHFRTVGKIGSRIVLDHGEVLDKDGNFYRENYRNADSQVIYITDGNQENWYHPIFSFQGFRYIRLTEYPATDIYPGDFRAISVHSDIRRTGRFSCSDPLVNRLYENVLWSQRDNFLDIPTDCPQRDERYGWTGDAQVFCRTAAYNFDVSRFFRKWLRDLAADQAPNGAVPDIVPKLYGDGLWGDGDHGSFGWGDAATVCPWELYMAYGDREMLAEQFPCMKKWVDFLKNKGNTPEEWNRKNWFGDWLGLDGEEGSKKGATSDPLLATAFLVYASTLLIKAGHALGMDMREYEELKAFVSEVFRQNFVGDDGMLTCDTQTAYVCALVFGLAPDPAKYAAHLARKIHDNGDHLQTGFLGTAYIMDALSENGYADVAYTLLLQKTYPSWLYCVRKGATTIWEHWDGLKPDGSMWDAEMNSFNHYAYGAVASWLYGTVAGIRPLEPGYRRIRIAPVTDPRLDWAEGSVDTPYGTVSSRWEKNADGYSLTVTIPQGVTAEVVFGDIRKELAGGTHSIR